MGDQLELGHFNWQAYIMNMIEKKTRKWAQGGQKEEFEIFLCDHRNNVEKINDTG